ncbi:MAG: hypothetical protein GYA16_14260 [Spirochaetes bacterium]|nr:hypothetical protein [Spirochaetota bacterium]
MKKIIIPLFVIMFFIACSEYEEESANKNDDYLTYQYEISWDANDEEGVNSFGGGYCVYYAEGYAVDINKSNYVDVPYQGGDRAPTQATIVIKLKKDENSNYKRQVTYSVVVVAYATINGTKVYSRPSKQIQIILTI